MATRILAVFSFGYRVPGDPRVPPAPRRAKGIGVWNEIEGQGIGDRVWDGRGQGLSGRGQEV